MRLQTWKVLFMVAVIILVVGQVYRQATALPAEYRIDPQEVVLIRVAPYMQEGSAGLALDQKEDIQTLVRAYNSGINYRTAVWATTPELEMVVELSSGDTFYIRDYTSRVFWVSVERQGSVHEFRLSSRNLGREFGFLRQQLRPLS